jgi:SAM-dependent methyltransferase
MSRGSNWFRLRPGHSDAPATANIEANREKWGDRAYWEGDLHYGHRWSDQVECTSMAERYLYPFLRPLNDPRPDAAVAARDVLEISPGAGRFTVELLRFARRLALVDLNRSCIDICRERFRYYNHLEYHVNDGSSLEMVADESFDLIVSWDSFVHMDREVVAKYVAQFPQKLRPEGLAWIHHAAHGQTGSGWRSNMTRGLMCTYAERAGLLLRAQLSWFPLPDPPYYNDCISILQRP